MPAHPDELLEQVLGPVQHSHREPHLLCDVHNAHDRGISDHVPGMPVRTLG